MKRMALIILTLTATIASVAVLWAVIAAFADPTSSLVTVVGSMVWSTFGPFLFLTTVAACLIGIFLRLNGMRRLGGLVIGLSTVGLGGAGFILTRIAFAGIEAGGEINLPARFMLGDMKVPAPELVETVQSIDGMDMRAAIYQPPSSQGPAPIIVYIHGGGFMTGTNVDFGFGLTRFSI